MSLRRRKKQTCETKFISYFCIFLYFEFNKASIKRCRSLKHPNDVIAANTSASISSSLGMIVVYSNKKINIYFQ